MDPFVDEVFRVLTPEAFEFVLDNELRRAVRSQNYLTLLVVEPTTEAPDQPVTPDVVREVARVVSREIRETDLLAEIPEGQLSIVLLDADLQSSITVVDRLATRLGHYTFSTSVAFEMGVACCPTHGADPATLRRVAAAHPIRRLGEDRDNASRA